jgi:hypothetical protein
MNEERITVRITASGQTLEVVVLSKRADAIEVVLGEGVHSVRCRLTPTRNGMAYVGNAMGRELVYERARGQVVVDLDRANVGQASSNASDQRAPERLDESPRGDPRRLGEFDSRRTQLPRPRRLAHRRSLRESAAPRDNRITWPFGPT